MTIITRVLLIALLLLCTVSGWADTVRSASGEDVRRVGDVGLDHTQSMLNSVSLAVLGVVMTFAMAWFWFTKQAAVKEKENLAAARASLLERVAELEASKRLNDQMMTPIVTAFQAMLVKTLTHADKPEMDALMVKVGPPDILTETERARLMIMLQERTRDYGPEITPSERDAAHILPFVMKMAAIEQRNFAEGSGASELKLVTIISVVGSAGPGSSKQPEKKE